MITLGIEQLVGALGIAFAIGIMAGHALGYVRAQDRQRKLDEAKLLPYQRATQLGSVFAQPYGADYRPQHRVVLPTGPTPAGGTPQPRRAR